MTTSDLTPFCRHYLIAALWSTTDNADDSGGEPLENNYNVRDIAPETIKEAAEECDAFRCEVEAILETHGCPDLWDAEQFGHDFWLSRNGHGAGFFDRGNEPVWQALQRAAKVWGSVDLYVGDDGQIHS